MKCIFLPLLALAVQEGSLSAQEAPDQFLEPGAREENYTMRITARVIDEQGNPLPNTTIRIGIHNVNDYKDEYNDFRGKTDAEGKFSAEGMGRGLAKIEVNKDGFYVSRKAATCYEGTPEQVRKAGEFFPWDPVVDIAVRKIENPIPMRVWLGGTKGTHRAPKVGQEFGFDLFEKDWVKPHGKGKKADLFVKFESKVKDQDDYKTSCSIRFVNPDDGFIPVPELVNKDSRLKYPREAPLDGYRLKELLIERSSGGVGARNKAEEQEPIGYLLRFRSVKDKKTGEIVSAYFGKITRPMERVANVNPFQISTFARDADRKLVLVPRFRFSFYLNPNLNDRNLEYDQESNLAPGAPQGVTWLP